MLDPALLRANPAELAERLRTSRGFELDVGHLELLEARRKQLQVRTQELQNLRNTRSKQIGMLKAKGEDVSAVMAEVAGFGEELKASEIRLDELRGEIEAIALGIGMVHQHFMLVPVFSVAENIMLGHEPSKFGVINLDEA